jgi:hypothetical protein
MVILKATLTILKIFFMVMGRWFSDHSDAEGRYRRSAVEAGQTEPGDCTFGVIYREKSL